MSAASHVQLLPVVETCSQFLQSQLDLDNCIDIATIAEIYSLRKLRKCVYQFICANLNEFCHTSEFSRLTQSQFEYILACNYPVNCSETEVLSSVVKWMKHDRQNRIPSAKYLLRHIQSNQLPPECISEFFDSSLHDEILATCSQIDIFQWSSKRNSRYLMQRKPHDADALINMRGMEHGLLKVGGFSVSGITNEITYYLQSVGKWRHLTSIPHVDQCNFGTTVLNNELYVVGGCFNQSLQENVHPFGFVYNPATSEWSTISPMLNERCRFSLTVVQGQLYAIGGVGESGDNESFFGESSPCEVYNPSEDSWAPIAPLPGWRSQHAGCSWRSYLFVCGGLDQDLVLNSCFRYNVDNDSWEERQPLLIPRADHAMVTYKNRIFVCGGWHEDENNGTRVLCDTIDCYDIAGDEWSTETKVPTPRYHAGIVIIDNLIYVMGGFHSDATFDRASGVIECYDIEARQWLSMKKYPHEVWEHSCCSLYVPTCRDDLDVLPNIQS